LQYRTLLSIPAYTWFLYLLPMTRRLFNDHVKLVNLLSVSFSHPSLDESKIGIVSTHWPTGWTGSPCWQFSHRLFTHHKRPFCHHQGVSNRKRI
jgi:hypothetical protein